MADPFGLPYSFSPVEVALVFATGRVRKPGTPLRARDRRVERTGKVRPGAAALHQRGASVKRTLGLRFDKIRLWGHAQRTEVRGTAAVEASMRGAGRPANT